MTQAKQPDTTKQRFSLPYKVKIEPRLDTPTWLPTAVSVGAVVLGLVFGAIALRLAGQRNPFGAFASIAGVLFGSLGGISDVLVQATPLILVGLAC